MVDLSTTQMGVDTIDMLTLEIPPFITESQLAIALYHIKVFYLFSIISSRSHMIVGNHIRSSEVSNDRRNIPIYCGRLQSNAYQSPRQIK